MTMHAIGEQPAPTATPTSICFSNVIRDGRRSTLLRRIFQRELDAEANLDAVG